VRRCLWALTEENEVVGPDIIDACAEIFAVRPSYHADDRLPAVGGGEPEQVGQCIDPLDDLFGRPFREAVSDVGNVLVRVTTPRNSVDALHLDAFDCQLPAPCALGQLAYPANRAVSLPRSQQRDTSPFYGKSVCNFVGVAFDARPFEGLVVVPASNRHFFTAEEDDDIAFGAIVVTSYPHFGGMLGDN
jgi:hypothetical protein